jgi:hypothetical protein
MSQIYAKKDRKLIGHFKEFGKPLQKKALEKKIFFNMLKFHAVLGGMLLKSDYFPLNIDHCSQIN